MTRLARRSGKEKVKTIPPVLISLDTNPIPGGFFKTFTAGESFTAPVVVCLNTNGKVYRCSSTYTNIVGVAIDSSSGSGSSVRVIVTGVAQVVADGAINIGDPVTFSTSTPGRVVKYTGHGHGVSTSTTTVLSDITPSTDTLLKDITTSTGTFVNDISTGTKTLYYGTIDVLYDVDYDSQYTTDSSGYIRHKHGRITTNVINSLSTSGGTPVDSFLASIVPETGSAITSITKSTATAVTGITKSTASVLSSVSVNASAGRMLGIALTSASSAGTTITILILPAIV